MSDAYGAAAIRRRVLDAWSASPARFREDANAEEDYAHRSYADRLVIELAQNAADAAAGAAVPGRLHFLLTPQALYAANAGAPLTAAGVESLSHLRTSTKGEGAIGRFGVGFKAVLPITDEPAVFSRTGGVRWSRSETAALVDEVPELRAEVARRAGAVPVMRLPFSAEPDETVVRLLAAGYDTVVVLPWRDDAAAQTAAELVEGLDPTLQLFLPGLTRITVESPEQSWSLTAEWDGEYVTLGGRRWWVRTESGDLPTDLLDARPVEDRERAGWQASVALAVDGRQPVPVPVEFDRVLRAPQPTEELLTLPAIVAASVPLDTARRHAASGALTDFVLGRAAAVYADLLVDAPPAATVLDLVPTGMPACPVDAVLRSALADRLATSAFLTSAADESIRLRPAEAAVVEAGNASYDVTGVLAPLIPQLISPEHSRRHGVLAALGVRRLDTADVVDLLAGLDQPAAWWAGMLAALAAVPDRDALRALRVPLADGRLAGPGDVLLPVAGVDLEPLLQLGISLRVVHLDSLSAASIELLKSLGAADADAGVLLDEPELRMAVETSLDDDPAVAADQLAAAVLSLARQRPQAARERTWLAELALRTDEGELQAAGELLLPAQFGGRLVALMRNDAPFGIVASDLVETHGAAALEAVGVLRSFAVVRADDVPAESAGAALFLDGEDRWLESLDPDPDGPPGLVTEVVAVRDLEWVAEDRWADALAELAGPELRPVVTEPARVLLADGRGVDRPSYTRWWLNTNGCVPLGDGRVASPAELRSAASEPVLAGLYDVVPPLESAAAGLVAELGALTSVDELIGRAPEYLISALERLGDPRRDVARHQLKALYGPVCAALAGYLDSATVPAIDTVRGIVRSTDLRCVPPADAVIVDRPDLLGLVGERPVVPVPLRAALDSSDVLEVPLASELSAYDVRSRPVSTRRWADVDGFAAAIERVGLVGSAVAAAVAQATFEEHEPLVSEDADGMPIAVAWRLRDGAALVSKTEFVHGASRALSALLGCWQHRNAVAAMLAYPDRAGALLAEAELD